MWRNPEFWRRLVAALLTATEEGHLDWIDTPEEPTLRALFADARIYLMLPEAGGGPPEVHAFDRYGTKVGVFRPEQAEDVKLVEQLFRLVDRVCRRDDEGYSMAPREGEWVAIGPVLRSVEAELAGKKSANGAAATKVRR